MTLLESIRKKADRPELTWVDVVSACLGTAIYGAGQWAARTVVVVATLRVLDVI